MTAEIDHLAEARKLLFGDGNSSVGSMALGEASVHAMIAQVEVLHEIAHQMRAPQPDPVIYCSAYLTNVNGEHRTHIPCSLPEGHDSEHHFTTRGRR